MMDSPSKPEDQASSEAVKEVENKLDQIQLDDQELPEDLKKYEQGDKEEVKEDKPEEEKKEGLDEKQGDQIVAVEDVTTIKNLVDIKSLYSSRKWDSFKFKIPQEIMLGIQDMKFPRPSKIQGSALGLIMKQNEEGKYDHLIAQAKNGSGKTAAFVIGTLLHVDPEDQRTQVICVAHTRELVKQIFSVFKAIGVHTKITMSDDSRGSEPQILVTTVYQALSYAKKGKKGKFNLKCFVADEIDVLFEDPKSADMMQDTLEYLKGSYPEVQCMFFSATMPQAIKKKIVGVIKEANQIALQQETKDLTIKQLKQFYIMCGEKKKPSLLDYIYSQMNITSTIIFVNTRNYAVKLTSYMRERGHSVSIIMGGDMHKEERDEIMQKFREGKTKVLISTDLLSRGIDVLEVNLVVNYDIPFKPNKFDPTQVEVNHETYLHRVGRTARYGRTGVAITFVANYRDEEFLNKISDFYKVDIQELKKEDVGKLIELSMNSNQSLQDDILNF